MTRPALRLMFAAAIPVLLVVHAIALSPSQLLWTCHIASLAIAIGLAADRPRMTAIGVLFHAGQGIPAFALNVFVVGTVSVTSVLLHTVPIAAGIWALWGRPLPRGILIAAWLLHPVAFVGAYLFSDPALNIMLVRAQYEVSASLFPALWIAWLAYGAAAFATLAIGWLLLRLVWRRWD